MTQASPAVCAVTSSAADFQLNVPAASLRLVYVSGIDTVWYRTDGTTAVVATDGNYPLRPGDVIERVIPADATAPKVNMVANTAVTVSLQKEC